MDVDAFFSPWESTIANFDEINGQLTTLFEQWVEENDRLFAWRGVVDASWPLHSSLRRRPCFCWQSTPYSANHEDGACGSSSVSERRQERTRRCSRALSSWLSRPRPRSP